MTRNTFGNLIFTMSAVVLFTILLYLFRGSAVNTTGHVAMVWALIVTIAVAGLVRWMMRTLRRRGAKR